MNDDASILPSLLGELSETEQQFLSGKRDRSTDLESAVPIFLEFLRGFEFFGSIDRPCVTVFGSARFSPGHRYYEIARELGKQLARAGYGVMTGGGPGIMEAANRGAKETLVDGTKEVRILARRSRYTPLCTVSAGSAHMPEEAIC